MNPWSISKALGDGFQYNSHFGYVRVLSLDHLMYGMHGMEEVVTTRSKADFHLAGKSAQTNVAPF